MPDPASLQPQTPAPSPAPPLAPSKELQVLALIIKKVELLTPASKVWLYQRLDAEINGSSYVTPSAGTR